MLQENRRERNGLVARMACRIAGLALVASAVSSADARRGAESYGYEPAYGYSSYGTASYFSDTDTYMPTTSYMSPYDAAPRYAPQMMAEPRATYRAPAVAPVVFGGSPYDAMNGYTAQEAAPFMQAPAPAARRGALVPQATRVMADPRYQQVAAPVPVSDPATGGWFSRSRPRAATTVVEVAPVQQAPAVFYSANAGYPYALMGIPDGPPKAGSAIEIDLGEGVGTFGDYTFAVLGGKPSHPTPTGSFRVNTKSKDHYSRKYEADMPYSLFFTAQCAIHQGSMRTESHGCIHVDEPTAQYLYENSNIGTRVIVRR